MNNAGFGIPAKPLDECTSEEVNKVIGICLIAVTNCMIEEIKIMKENAEHLNNEQENRAGI